MVEAGANEVTEAEILDALDIAHGEIKKLCEAQRELQKKAGKEKAEVEVPQVDEKLLGEIKDKFGDALNEATQVEDKLERQDATKKVEEEVFEAFGTEGDDTDVGRAPPGGAARLRQAREGHDPHADRGRQEAPRRPQGRRDPRHLDRGRRSRRARTAPRCSRAARRRRSRSPRSARRARRCGSTRSGSRPASTTSTTTTSRRSRSGRPGSCAGRSAATSATARSPSGRSCRWSRRSRTSRTRSASSPTSSSRTARRRWRRCAARASSLMDAGVPIKRPVAGIAMGLIKEGDDYIVLSDIAGVEDHLGDMDFKVAGTEKGITALQMDIKITGVTFDILRDALEQAKEGRTFILGKMAEVIDAPREEMSEYAPRISSIQIDTDKIGMVIGKGGETIRALSEEFEAQIDVNDDGIIRVYARTGALGDALVERIESMTKDVEVGDTFTGKVVKTTTFGAFIELSKGTDGLLHISNVKPGERVDTVEDVLERGQEIDVRVVEVDRERGRIGLRLADDPEVDGKTAEELAAVGTGDAGPRGGGRGGDRGGRGGDRGGRGGRDGRGRNGGGRDRDRGGAAAATGSTDATAGIDLSGQQHKLTELDSGVRVVTEKLPSVRSIALGFWVRTGSRNETVEQAGISHFLEHLLFKGTDRFSSIEIDEIFDGMGAEINAGTGKETTSVYSRFLDQHLERAFDVMADMVLRPVLPGHRLRAPGGVRGDRDVRGRAVGQGARRPRERGLRRPSAGPAGDRPRRGHLVGAGPGHRPLPRPPLQLGQPGPGGRGQHRPRPARRAGRGRSGRAAGRAERQRRSAGRLRGAPPLPPEGDRAVPPLRRRARPGPRRRAALRAAGPRHDPGRVHVVAAVPGDPREARAGLRGLLVPEPLRRLRPDGHLRRHAARERPRGLRDHRPRARAHPHRAGDAGRARPGQGERQGPHRPVDGVAARADEPPGQRAPDGHPAADARRDAGEDRRRHAGRRRELAAELLAADRLCAAGVGGHEEVFRDAIGAVSPALAAA